MDANVMTFPATLVDVFSGDDLVLMVDLGVENLFKRQRVRLHGVDTPNAVRAAADSEAGQVRSEVREMLRNKRLSIAVVSKTSNSWVVDLWVDSGDAPMNVNKYLVEKGYRYER